MFLKPQCPLTSVYQGEGSFNKLSSCSCKYPGSSSQVGLSFFDAARARVLMQRAQATSQASIYNSLAV